MKLAAVQSNASLEAHRQTLGPELCVIDMVSFMEVLRRQMVTGRESLWEAADDGALRISFPGTDEADMIIAADEWHIDPYRRQGRHPHLRLV